MASLKKFFNEISIPELIDQKNSVKEYPRPYLGMSQIGANCKRSLWYYFHFCSYSTYNGRVQRIFNTGHGAEEIMIKDLESIGIECWDTLDAQAEFVDVDGYSKGHGDGMCRKLPESPKTDHVLEFKTMADKYFNELKKKGVEKAKYVYFIQMIIYMYKSKSARALLMVYNKNTSAYHTERIKANNNLAIEMLGFAHDVVYSKDANEFPKVGTGRPNYYECSYCNFNSVCHYDEKPLVTCRTCTSLRMPGDGKFVCGLTDKVLSVEEQQKACNNYGILDCFL